MNEIGAQNPSYEGARYFKIQLTPLPKPFSEKLSDSLDLRYYSRKLRREIPNYKKKFLSRAFLSTILIYGGAATTTRAISELVFDERDQVAKVPYYISQTPRYLLGIPPFVAEQAQKVPPFIAQIPAQVEKVPPALAKIPDKLNRAKEKIPEVLAYHHDEWSSIRFNVPVTCIIDGKEVTRHFYYPPYHEGDPECVQVARNIARFTQNKEKKQSGEIIKKTPSEIEAEWLKIRSGTITASLGVLLGLRRKGKSSIDRTKLVDKIFNAGLLGITTKLAELFFS